MGLHLRASLTAGAATVTAAVLGPISALGTAAERVRSAALRRAGQERDPAAPVSKGAGAALSWSARLRASRPPAGPRCPQASVRRERSGGGPRELLRAAARRRAAFVRRTRGSAGPVTRRAAGGTPTSGPTAAPPSAAGD
ncbi:hypothetical protein ACIP88_33120 [Streptomyces uncialis]|uniref:hypothetical protein n=1 Tax=Streptomyces uncialis TaxID=1048205 RepID=UPI003824CA61